MNNENLQHCCEVQFSTDICYGCYQNPTESKRKLELTTLK